VRLRLSSPPAGGFQPLDALRRPRQMARDFTNPTEQAGQDCTDKIDDLLKLRARRREVLRAMPICWHKQRARREAMRRRISQRARKPGGSAPDTAGSELRAQFENATGRNSGVCPAR
jgi:hypothetical protein